MSAETRFLSSLIRKARTRLTRQAKIVAELPPGASSKEAVQACDTLQTMNDRVVKLRAERAKLQPRSTDL